MQAGTRQRLRIKNLTWIFDMNCKLCEEPCGLYVDWHSDCWVEYQEFLKTELLPLTQLFPYQASYIFNKEWRTKIDELVYRE